MFTPDGKGIPISLWMNKRLSEADARMVGLRMRQMLRGNRKHGPQQGEWNADIVRVEGQSVR